MLVLKEMVLVARGVVVAWGVVVVAGGKGYAAGKGAGVHGPPEGRSVLAILRETL